MNPLAPGNTTSEWTLAKVAVIIGVVLQASAGAIYELQGAGITFPWFPMALAGIGTVLQLLTFVGYNKGRVLVKAEAIRAGLVDAAAMAASLPTPPARPAAMPMVTASPVQPVAPNP